MRVASLFSGCGGLDLGIKGNFYFLGRYYEELPYNIVFSNDIDIDAINVYNENMNYFNHSNVLHQDICDVDFSQIEDFEVLMAGFPCQPFSNAGKRKGVLDSRGTLFEEVIRAVEAKKPKVIVMENVRGILSSKMPSGKKVTDEIKDKLQTITTLDGEIIRYNVLEPKLVRSSNFGVPQNRFRVLMVAFREDVDNVTTNLDEIHNFVTNFDENDLLLGNAIANVELLPNTQDIWELSPQSMDLVHQITRSWKDIPYENLPDRLKRIRDNMKVYHSPNFYRRFGLNEINGTITASAQPEKCGIVHPIEHRRFSVREIARIQSFPDDFTFNSISLQSKYKVIGNAVPPVMAHAIGKFILSKI